MSAKRCSLLLGFAMAAACARPGCSQLPASSTASLRDQATAARDRGDLTLASGLYKQALAADAGWTEGWWFLGNLQYQLNQYAAAQDSLSQYIASAPKAIAALALRGLCEYELGQWPASLADIEQALSLGAANQPRNAQILLYHQALLLTRMGRFEEAIAKYKLFVQQGLTNDDVAVGLGLAGLRIADPPSALSAADLQLATLSGHAAFGVIAGETAAGRKSFHDLYAAYPQHPNLHFFCGYLLLTTDPDQAVEEFRGELAVDPSNRPSRTMLAWTLELRGDFAEALPPAQQATREDAASTTNQLVLGRALLETGDAQGSLPHLQQALTGDPQNLEAHISLAKAYSTLGRKDEARQERLTSLALADAGAAHAP